MVKRILIILVLIPAFIFPASYAQSLQNLNLIALDSLNSDFDDSSPFIDKRTKELFFSVENSSGDKDIMIAKWTGNTWVKSKNKLPINNRFDNEICHVDSSGLVYFQKAILDEAGRAIFGIFTTQRSNGTWSKPQKQKIKYFNNKSGDQSFCLNENGNIMIISMQSYFSYGVEDLYVSFKTGENAWSEPKNLGASINTDFEEFTPFLEEDNHSLYFSSNGHKGGFGSKDIWVSYRLDSSWTKWTTPINLGPSVNTLGMETSFRRTGLKSIPYLVVTTRTSDGQSDIYGLKLNPTKIDSLIDLIKPEIINKSKSDDPLDTLANQDTANSTVLIDAFSNSDSSEAQILDSAKNTLILRAINKASNKPIPCTINYKSRYKKDSVFVKRDSSIKLTFDWLDTIEIVVKSPSFLPQTKTIIFENRHFGIELKEDIFLDSIEIGKLIQFEHVLFKRGTPELLEKSNTDLDYVAEILNDKPELEIQIAGHTDNSGNAYLNLLLSEKRANTIKKYLIAKGIEADRIETKGYGGSQPIASNDNEETMKLNRRVEFKLIEKD